MARARNVKPAFFENEILGTLAPHARLLFVALWLLADCEGRLENRPARIRAFAFPYETVDCEILLRELAATGFIEIYEVDGNFYIEVLNFSKHQNPHPREAKSTIPAPLKTKSNAKALPSREKVLPSPADSPSLNPDSPTTPNHIPRGRGIQ